MTRNDWYAFLIGLALLLTLLFLPVPAAAEGANVLYVPIVRQDVGRDWFTDAELDAVMHALGFVGDEWDMHVNCTLDETANPAAGVLRYSTCTLFLSEDTNDNQAIVFWFDAVAGRMAWSYATGIFEEGG